MKIAADVVVVALVGVGNVQSELVTSGVHRYHQANGLIDYKSVFQVSENLTSVALVVEILMA